MFNNYWKNIWKTLTHISVRGRSSKKEFLRFFVLRLILISSTFLFLQLPAAYVQEYVLQKSEAVLPISQSLTILLYFLCVGGIHIIFNLWASIAEIALNIRRFHDFDKSGWFVLLFWLAGLLAVIVIALFVLITAGVSFNIPKENIKALSSQVCNFLAYGLYLIMCCICIFKNGTAGSNKYGEAIIEIDN